MKLKEWWSNIDFRSARWTLNNIGMYKAGYKDGFERGKQAALEVCHKHNSNYDINGNAIHSPNGSFAITYDIGQLGEEQEKSWHQIDDVCRIYCTYEFLISIGKDYLPWRT